MVRKKTLVALVIPFLPVFLIVLCFAIRHFRIYDIDVPVLFIILSAPLFFIIGGVFSIYEVKHAGKKTWPITALVINIAFFVLFLVAWSGIRIG